MPKVKAVWALKAASGQGRPKEMNLSLLEDTTGSQLSESSSKPSVSEVPWSWKGVKSERSTRQTRGSVSQLISESGPYGWTLKSWRWYLMLREWMWSQNNSWPKQFYSQPLLLKTCFFSRLPSQVMAPLIQLWRLKAQNFDSCFFSTSLYQLLKWVLVAPPPKCVLNLCSPHHRFCFHPSPSPHLLSWALARVSKPFLLFCPAPLKSIPQLEVRVIIL